MGYRPWGLRESLDTTEQLIRRHNRFTVLWYTAKWFSFIYMFFFIFFSFIVYYRILNIVPWAIQ